MDYTLWYGGAKADAEYLIRNTNLSARDVQVKEIQEASHLAFVDNPDAIKDILYLDKPDLILTAGFPERPILGVEFSKEAMSGHDAFQRFARVVAGAEFQIPYAYVLPPRKWIERSSGGRWDRYNPTIFTALRQVTRFHQVPALAFFWDTQDDSDGSALSSDPHYPQLPDSGKTEMQRFFEFIDLIIGTSDEGQDLTGLLHERFVMDWEAKSDRRLHERLQDSSRNAWSPMTSTEVLDDSEFGDYFRRHLGDSPPVDSLPDYVRKRPHWVVYSNASSTFRADPYGGSALAIDYMHCRTGATARERDRNLVVHFSEVSISDVEDKWEHYYEHRCPFRSGYSSDERYLTMHLREGCRFTKQKEIRLFFSACDLVMFKDGFLF